MDCIEICAGAGGQALGLEQAGFEAHALVEIDRAACATLRMNRPEWNIIEDDVKRFDASPYKHIDLIAGGVPCPPFSVAGKQLGASDERDLFPEALRLIDEARPSAVMLENVRGFLDPEFREYRDQLKDQLRRLGYSADWRLLNASDFGVSQLRPRVVIVAIKKEGAEYFSWPTELSIAPLPVGPLLLDLMSANDWEGAHAWSQQANTIAPTIVGGSKKHGGPDLGPTRAKKAWASLHVDGHGIAEQSPLPGFAGMPRLTTRMVARIQGFPDSWAFFGKKTPVYRQIGNAFPPPVAQAVAAQLRKCLLKMQRITAVAEAVHGR